ncbi:zinc-dependent alcohol dehydrogenase family protein [Aspergillus ibericus CBS 121593]|uniref:Putative zinc-type alcohol dehydrogenase-like protein n=1 Tax=Aspergillus ibericus CBS 121593 TaxID=1448316 RepID=A0A395GIM7_9EURO|nr:putative zinc-type alcohol dehydrogenase-like protein [Aspergillus ibericus CBS 121593]RAK95310.1 putative zinc-type alcohol dehydrogenase-like protein [Aspergillus ibericus CBS 121593]
MASHTVFRLPSRTSVTDLVAVEERIPSISKHEVLIKVRAVSLNSRDIQVASGTYPAYVKENVIPGSDAAGDIISVGEEVRDLVKGDRVVVSFDIAHMYGPQKDFLTGQGGGVDGVLAQYIARPASSVVKVPASAPQSYSELASLVCTGVTSWNALYGNMPLKPGQTVLVQGTGGVSMTAVVLAKAAGATTIVTSSSDEKLEFVQSHFQPDHCINYRKTPDWASQALELTGGKGVDHIIEIGGIGTIEQSIRAIAPGGIISVIGYLASVDPSQRPDVPLLALLKNCVVRGVLVGPRCMLEDLMTFVDRRKLRFHIAKEYAFTREDIIAAYQAVEAGKHVAKVCIVMDWLRGPCREL